MLDAVRTLAGPLEIVSDSTYVVNCFRDRWWEGWLARGWMNKARKPVANRDLWEPLIDLYRADPKRLRFTWVKGHSGDVMNDVVDRLAVEAAVTQVGRVSDEPPTEVGPPDPLRRPLGPQANRVERRDAGDDGLPAGRRIAVVGARPPQMGGYTDNMTTDAVRKRLTEILVAKQELHGNVVVLSGLGLGAEQLGAEAAIEAGLPFVAVLPYPSPDSVWPPASQQRFRRLLEAASVSVVLQGRVPETKQKAGGALARRDAWLARHADEAIAVWDGQDPATGKQVRSLQDVMGEEDVWVVRPI